MPRPESFVCPVCNGFTSIQTICPKCGSLLNDNGRFFDILAAYSPYRPIEDMKLSDDWIDAATHLCPHHVYCPNCNFNDVRFVGEMYI
jgi:hypothetical protein